MKFIRTEKNLLGKTVLLRTDLDAPHDQGVVADQYRIQMAVPTIQFLHKAGAKVIVISKTGQPKPNDKSETMLPQVQCLADLLGRKLVTSADRMPDYDINHIVFFTGDIRDERNIQLVKSSASKDIIVLENIRFYPEETSGDANFAKLLAGLGDIYVNDAFAVCHRNDVSVAMLPKLIPAYVGLNLELEVSSLGKVLTSKKHPFVLLMGGAKITDKVGTIRNLGRSADKILIGGALANLFFLSKGMSVGKSLAEAQSVELANEIMRNFKDKIVLPEDVIVAEAGTLANPHSTTPDVIKDNESVLDIGPKTIFSFAQEIKQAKQLVWNGPMGYFENRTFSHGTTSIAEIFASRCQGAAYGVIGGGDTLDAVHMAKVADQIDFVSTGGGSMLEFLAGEDLPGLDALGYGQ